MSGPLARTLRRLAKRKMAVGALVFLTLLIPTAVMAEWLVTHDPNAQSLVERFQGPGLDHWLGTDDLGRDIFSRLIVGARITFIAVGIALAIAMLLGVPLGLLTGGLGGRAGSLISRVFDGILALPSLIVVLAIIGILGTGLVSAMTALGFVLAPRFFRVARGAASAISGDPFIEAARADGCSGFALLWRHIAPNALGPIIVEATFAVGLIITAEASLSFLGLGVQLPLSSWGSMLHDGFNFVRIDAYPLVPPSVAIVATILAVFVLGDEMRDAVGTPGMAE